MARFDHRPLTVTNISGSRVTAKRGPVVIVKNASLFKVLPLNVQIKPTTKKETYSEDLVETLRRNQGTPVTSVVPVPVVPCALRVPDPVAAKDPTSKSVVPVPVITCALRVPGPVAAKDPAPESVVPGLAPIRVPVRSPVPVAVAVPADEGPGAVKIPER